MKKVTREELGTMPFEDVWDHILYLERLVPKSATAEAKPSEAKEVCGCGHVFDGILPHTLTPQCRVGGPLSGGNKMRGCTHNSDAHSCMDGNCNSATTPPGAKSERPDDVAIGNTCFRLRNMGVFGAKPAAEILEELLAYTKRLEAYEGRIGFALTLKMERDQAQEKVKELRLYASEIIKRAEAASNALRACEAFAEEQAHKLQGAEKRVAELEETLCNEMEGHNAILADKSKRIADLELQLAESEKLRLEYALQTQFERTSK